MRCSAPRCARHAGSRTLKDAINEAHARLGDERRTTRTTCSAASSARTRIPRWCATFHQVIGSGGAGSRSGAGGPPAGLLRRLCRRRQQLDRPVPCLSPDESRTRLIGVEAGGRGSRRWASTRRGFSGGVVGVLHGTRTRVLQDREGQIAATHSVSAGLDYPAWARSTPSSSERDASTTADAPMPRRSTRSRR